MESTAKRLKKSLHNLRGARTGQFGNISGSPEGVQTIVQQEKGGLRQVNCLKWMRAIVVIMVNIKL